jgi:hypothetical protein
MPSIGHSDRVVVCGARLHAAAHRVRLSAAKRLRTLDGARPGPLLGRHGRSVLDVRSQGREWSGVCRSGGAEPLVPLGHDFLKFLAAFVIITPVFKRINVSPILGFLLAGLLLRQAKCALARVPAWQQLCNLLPGRLPWLP